LLASRSRPPVSPVVECSSSGPHAAANPAPWRPFGWNTWENGSYSTGEFRWESAGRIAKLHCGARVIGNPGFICQLSPRPRQTGLRCRLFAVSSPLLLEYERQLHVNAEAIDRAVVREFDLLFRNPCAPNPADGLLGLGDAFSDGILEGSGGSRCDLDHLGN
jgi:hypothetical protein